MMSKPKKMSDETIKKVDEMFRDRWRTLLSVDVMVDKVVAALKHYNMLDNTYIILTSDNGFHMGQFALPLDKRLPYEFDIRVRIDIKIHLAPQYKPFIKTCRNAMKIRKIFDKCVSCKVVFAILDTNVDEWSQYYQK